jgi:hypothetical protein
MIGDKVVVGMGSVQISRENIPVYTLVTDQNGKIQFDNNGAAMPKVAGGVKGCSYGRIHGDPVKVNKAALVGGVTGAAFGTEYVILIPVYLDYYKTVGWFPQEHVHIIGDLTRT